MLEDQSVKVCYLDASALVKLVVEERGSQAVRDFFNANTNFCATSLCLVEALGVLKGKWGRNEIQTDEYFAATRRLIIDAWGKRLELDDVGLVNPSVHAEVEKVAKKHVLDLSDALQLVTILRGRYSVLGPKSVSVLITADSKLAAAAFFEGIRVWNCMADPAPPWRNQKANRDPLRGDHMANATFGRMDSKIDPEPSGGRLPGKRSIRWRLGRSVPSE